MKKEEKIEEETEKKLHLVTMTSVCCWTRCDTPTSNYTPYAALILGGAKY